MNKTDSGWLDPQDMDQNEKSRPLRGVVAVVMRSQQLLVIRRSQFVVAPRLLCFPGGAIEEGESEEAALVREVYEELGVTVTPLRALWQSVTAWQVEIRWWHAELDHAAVPIPNEAEVESFHWMTLDELRSSDDLLQSNHDFLAAITAREVEI